MDGARNVTINAGGLYAPGPGIESVFITPLFSLPRLKKSFRLREREQHTYTMAFCFAELSLVHMHQAQEQTLRAASSPCLRERGEALFSIRFS